MTAVMMIPIYSVRTGQVEQINPVVKSDAEWRAVLTPQQFDVARKRGTELAFTGKYHDGKKNGVYLCACCRTDLFLSDAKFDSGTGWPSFSKPVRDEAVKTKTDFKLLLPRSEGRSTASDAPLGHVF